MDRIQRKRTKGFKLPPNTLVITRPTKWGNPFKKDEAKESLVNRFRLYINNPLHSWIKESFIRHCIKNNIEHLACFCPVDSPCHGDVWLDVWNEYKSGQSAESE